MAKSVGQFLSSWLGVPHQGQGVGLDLVDHPRRLRAGGAEDVQGDPLRVGNGVELDPCERLTNWNQRVGLELIAADARKVRVGPGALIALAQRPST